MSHEMTPFYEVKDVPVHSVLLVRTKEDAINFKKRDIKLGYCENCGFISNIIFDPTVHDYSSEYEETQGFSGTFNKFHKKLAEDLIEKYDLRKKTVIEIGCGKGDFLNLICEIGDNDGIGFDPAYIPERDSKSKQGNVKFIKDFYSEKYTHYKADFICCKMTLEHIPDTFNFIKMVRNSIGDNLETKVFFQIPDTDRVLSDLGFWDIYYEHCSYFSVPSLTYLFEKAGFKVLSTGREYDGQYLMIEALPVKDSEIKADLSRDTSTIKSLVNDFASRIDDRLNEWREVIAKYKKKGKKIALWGGGSKAVAFLTTLGFVDEIPYAVDINPFKHGTFLAGNGQEIVSPEFLTEYQPDIVIVMNPIYVEEISKDLNKLKLNPTMLPIDFLDKVENKAV
jgi:SAM-dependent methyltransferase